MKKIKNNITIHETAEVHKDTKIGENTRIWNQAQIRENAVIGKNCNIGKNVYIDKNVIIGNNVKIQNNVSLWDGVVIEDFVFIGPDACFATDRYPRAAIWNEERKGRIILKKGSSIGANATIVANATLGEYCMVGASSLVKSDVPPHGLVVGIPAKLIGFVCECGFKAEKYDKNKSKIFLKFSKCHKKFDIDKKYTVG